MLVDQSSAVHPVDRFSEESVVGSTWASDGSGEVGGVFKDRVDDSVNSGLEGGVIPVEESATRVSGLPREVTQLSGRTFGYQNEWSLVGVDGL